MAERSWQEWAIGAGLGIAVFLISQGVPPVPLILLAGLGVILYMAPRLSAGRLGHAALGESVERTNVTFADVGGQAAAKRELKEALDFLCAGEAARRLGIRPLKGILLTGPPGTGKTLLARAAAHYTGSAFLAAAGSEFIEMYAGVGAQRVRDLFRRARGRARQENVGRAIVFIDEMEVLGSRRGGHQGHLEYDQTLNQLLVEMDGMSAADDVTVLVIGATNRADLMDEALLRPGRFDRLVRVDLPDREGRRQILEVHMRGRPLADGVDLGQVATETFSFSGAHLESLANEAAILALREGAERIDQRHLLEAVDKVMLGETADRRPSAEEKRRVAIHEGGHALVAETVRPGSVAQITLVPRGEALGYVRRAPREDGDAYLVTEADLRGDIAVALAGSVAELSLLGSRSTGARSDFHDASQAAHQMVLSGMSSLGVVDEHGLGEAALAKATGEILAAVEAEVKQVIAEHAGDLERLADRLLADEHLDGERLREVLELAPRLAPELQGG